LAEPEPPLTTGAPAGAPRSVTVVQLALAAEDSTLPAASVARTATVCWPSASPLYVQAVHAPPWSWHCNVEPLSVAVNANVGVASFVAEFGPELIVVSGAVVSGGGAVATVNERVAGEASVFARRSVARADKCRDRRRRWRWPCPATLRPARTSRSQYTSYARAPDMAPA
jgi:hypothetical protein